MICRLSKGAVCTVCSMFKCDVTTFYMCLNYRFMLCCLPWFWNHRFKYFLYNTQTKATEMTQLIDSASWKYCKQSFTGVCWKGILSCKCGKQLTYWNNLPCDDYIIDICVFNTFFFIYKLHGCPALLWGRMPHSFCLWKNTSVPKDNVSHWHTI